MKTFSFFIAIVICSTTIYAQNVGIGLANPTNKLQVSGSILVSQPTVSTNTAPVASQIKTMNNGAETDFLAADSVIRIYDPGGPAGNYINNLQAYAYMPGDGMTLGFQVTVEDIQLGTGDTLFFQQAITSGSSAPQTLALNSSNAVIGASYRLDGSLTYMTFKSNSDGNNGRGFSLLIKRLFSDPAADNSIKDPVGNSFFFDASTGSMSSGTIGSNKPALYSSSFGNSAALAQFSTAGGSSAAKASGASAFGSSTASGIESFSACVATAGGIYSAALGNGNASGDYSFAAGSGQAQAVATTAFGASTASSPYSFSSGQISNATNQAATAMGTSNASGLNSVALGNANASGSYAAALGKGTASGNNSFAAGIAATAQGNNSVALGTNITASLKGDIFFGDSDPFNRGIRSMGTADQMACRFNGGYFFITSNSAGDIGVQCLAGQNSWSAISDVRRKENFLPLNGEDILKKIAGMPLTTWNYKGQDPRTFRHYGPMAQDFFAAFGRDDIGVIGCDTLINQQDFLGVNLVAIQALEKRTEKIDEVIKANELLQLENADLKKMMLQMRKELDAIKRKKHTGK